VQLHFLAAALPLVPGRPLYHTRLFVNIEGQPPLPPPVKPTLKEEKSDGINLIN